MSRLNPRQLQAVEHIDSPLLVLAGAGSGKTRVITEKLAWLHRSGRYLPEGLFAVTFTNKAAREMKSRAAKTLGAEAADRLNISTFHTLGLNMIRRELDVLGYRSGFSIFDADDTLNLIAELTRQDGKRNRGALLDIQYQISRWKTALMTVEAVLALGEPLAQVYAGYEKHLRAYNAFDFDDLIAKPLHLLQSDPLAMKRWRDRVGYLLVDEYQDTNNCQYELIKALVGDKSGLTVVGDDDQSIYTWRGARPENLLTLQSDYPNLAVIKLEQNYRSTNTILQAANALIANNSHLYEKRLWSELGSGELINVLDSDHEKHEAERIAGAIHLHQMVGKQKYGDYAILFRSNYQARELETALRELRIPYVLTGGTSFFDRSEIKDAMAYLRLLVNPLDDAAYLRIVNTPRRQIGPNTLEKLGRYASERNTSLLNASMELGLGQHLNEKSCAALRRFGQMIGDFRDRIESDAPAAIIRDLFRELDFDAWLREQSKDEALARRRSENIEELVQWLERLSRKSENSNLVEVVNRLCLLGMIDRDDDAQQDSVILMTLHSAKGLEFPFVYIAGVEEGLLPHQNSIEDDGLEEERRLAYVGITRAQKELTLCYARQRKRGGDMLDCEPSRFIGELPREFLAWRQRSDQSPEERRANGLSYLESIKNMLQSN